MPTDSLPNIPTPAAQRWREFRIQVMPVMMFLCLMVSLVFMWRSFVQPAGIIGEVQPLRANVLSLTDGLIADLTVGLYEEVVKDQVIGTISLKGEDVRNATFKSVETELLLVQQRMNVDKTRNMDSMAHLNTTLANEKINLALAEITMHYADREFERVKKF